MTQKYKDSVTAQLQRLGISPPPEDIPFLERSYSRQQELLARIEQRLPPHTEPAMVFKPAV